MALSIGTQYKCLFLNNYLLYLIARCKEELKNLVSLTYEVLLSSFRHRKTPSRKALTAR